MTSGEQHYFQPSQSARGNKCLQCGLGYSDGPHVRIDSYYVEEFKAGSEVYIPGTRPFKADRDRLHIYPKDLRAPGYDPYGIFPEGWDDSYKADPFPPDVRRRLHRETLAYYDEADLVVRGNPRHARGRVGIFKKLRKEYRDIKNYVNLSKHDKIVLGSGAVLIGIYITVNVAATLN